VPGAFELPLVAKRLAASGRYEAIIALEDLVEDGAEVVVTVVDQELDRLVAGLSGV
jgi:6,7-dimethyl-8-ribityllumazine synthase